tara:strand:+ start:7809 stop:8078 length:270 start_codon:yes stop_codon:yes gene_type:complete
MNVLVTGAAGFIGFHLSRRLLDEGYNIVGLDNINDYYDVSLKYARLKELGINEENAKRWNYSILSDKYNNFSFIRLDLEHLGILRLPGE